MVNITTSVDSLVTLVKKKGRISVEDAAKELGLSAEVIMEWANFLEEDKIIFIDYKITTPFLVDSSLKEKSTQSKEDAELYQTSTKNIVNFIKRTQPDKFPTSDLQKKAEKQKEALLQECADFLTTIMTPETSKKEFERVDKHFAIFKKTISKLE